MVYDSSTGAPISGVTLRVFYDDGEPAVGGELAFTAQANSTGNHEIDLPASRRQPLEVDVGPSTPGPAVTRTSTTSTS